MADNVINTKIIFRHGTTEEWENSEAEIKPGELVVEETENGEVKLKIGTPTDNEDTDT